MRVKLARTDHFVQIDPLLFDNELLGSEETKL